MNDPLILGSIALVVVLIAIYVYYWKKEKKMLQNSSIPSHIDQATPENRIPTPKSNPTLLPLQLQAYERLVILTERIALPNLILRIPPDNLEIGSYKEVLITQIRAEFEYNLSQQLYVSAEAWQAVTSLRDQNIFIINQISTGLNPNAAAEDFVQLVEELLNRDAKVSLHSVVLEALQFDVKKLMSQAS